MRRYKFDMSAIKSAYQRQIHLDWFTTFGVNHQTSIWILPESYSGSVKCMFSEENSGRQFYTDFEYFKPIITNTDLDQWL